MELTSTLFSMVMCSKTFDGDGARVFHRSSRTEPGTTGNNRDRVDRTNKAGGGSGVEAMLLLWVFLLLLRPQKRVSGQVLLADK